MGVSHQRAERYLGGHVHKRRRDVDIRSRGVAVPPDGVHVPDVASYQRHPFGELRVHREGVVRLLVLAPSDVTPESVVVEDDPLASQLEHGVLQARVSQEGAVELGVLRVGDHRILSQSVLEIVVAVGADGGDVLQVRPHEQAVILASDIAQTQAKRGGTGIPVKAVLVDLLVPVAQVHLWRATGQGLADGARSRVGAGQKENERSNLERS